MAILRWELPGANYEPSEAEIVAGLRRDAGQASGLPYGGGL